MSTTSGAQRVEAPAPPAALKVLGDRLVGIWKVSCEAEGETSWEWMEGGFFLMLMRDFLEGGRRLYEQQAALLQAVTAKRPAGSK
jgi:hypothetical protein